MNVKKNDNIQRILSSQTVDKLKKFESLLTVFFLLQ